MGVLRATLLVYVGCWKSCFAFVIVVFLELSHVSFKGVNACLWFTTKFGHVVVVREVHTFQFFTIFVFFAVLHDLCPIDGNYVLFVVVFDFWIPIRWDFSICVIHFVYLYYGIHFCFSTFNFANWFCSYTFVSIAISNWHVKITFWRLAFLFQWHVRVSKIEVANSVWFNVFFWRLWQRRMDHQQIYLFKFERHPCLRHFVKFHRTLWCQIVDFRHVFQA